MHLPKHNPGPPSTPALARIFWFGSATAICALVASAAWTLSANIEGRQTQSYSGVFESDTNAAPLVLPAGVALEKMLVLEGQYVEAGQKLARLDQALLRDLIHELHTSLALRKAEYACVVDTGSTTAGAQPLPEASPEAASPPDEKPSVATTAPQSETERDTLIRQCEAEKRVAHLAQQRLMHKRESLKRKSALAVQELLARAKTMPPTVEEILTLRAALERETLQSAVREIEFDIATLKATQDAERLAKLSGITADIKALEARLAETQALLSAPWLLAPANGQVTQLRSPPLATTSPEDQVLARLFDADATGYTAYFDLPATQAKYLPAGSAVRVSLAGGSIRARQAHGRIERTLYNSHLAQPTARVFVALDTAELDDASTAFLLATPRGTRSTLYVSQPAHSLQDVIRHGAGSVIQAFSAHE